MVCMFFNASTFNQDISDWNVSSLVLANGMFRGATNFNQDLSDWDTRKVTINCMKCSRVPRPSIRISRTGIFHRLVLWMISFLMRPHFPQPTRA